MNSGEREFRLALRLEHDLRQFSLPTACRHGRASKIVPSVRRRSGFANGCELSSICSRVLCSRFVDELECARENMGVPVKPAQICCPTHHREESASEIDRLTSIVSPEPERLHCAKWVRKQSSSNRAGGVLDHVGLAVLHLSGHKAILASQSKVLDGLRASGKSLPADLRRERMAVQIVTDGI